MGSEHMKLLGTLMRFLECESSQPSPPAGEMFFTTTWFVPLVRMGLLTWCCRRDPCR
jgi:hypothetical protein